MSFAAHPRKAFSYEFYESSFDNADFYAKIGVGMYVSLYIYICICIYATRLSVTNPLSRAFVHYEHNDVVDVDDYVVFVFVQGIQF